MPLKHKGIRFFERYFVLSYNFVYNYSQNYDFRNSYLRVFLINAIISATTLFSLIMVNFRNSETAAHGFN